MSNRNIEEQVQTVTTKFTNGIKNRMFDIIAAFLIIAMLMLHLGVLTLRDITFENIIVILLECIPFFITSVLLSMTFYNKGSFTGKQANVFTAAVTTYSAAVNALTGKHIAMLPTFCEEYNDTVLKTIQTNILKTAAITYERFNDGAKNDDALLPPLKVLSKKKLKTMYSSEQVSIIIKAKKVQIKGLNSNILLGNTYDEDTTNLGTNELEMSKANLKFSAMTFLIATLLMSFIGVRDVLQWGWVGLLLVAFKLIYVLCSSILKHFKGYNDITIRLVNHMMRKTDILKQFSEWFTTHDDVNVSD